MTEKEWLTTTDPNWMLQLLTGYGAKDYHPALTTLPQEVVHG